MPAAMGLHRVSNDELRRLVRAIYRGHLACPISRSGLVIAQFGDLEGHLNALVGRDQTTVLALVQAVLAERELATTGVKAQGTSTQLLWRGPTPPASGSREPLGLVADWLSQAERTVLWAGIPTSARHRLFQTLHAAQRGRDLNVQLLLCGDGDSAKRFMTENFYHGTPLPHCAYTPDAPPCLIVDGARVILFQSASDLLDSEDAGEIRTGLAAQDTALAASLTEHIQHLITTAASSAIVDES